MTGNRQWTDAERGVLRDLGREAPPPPGLEDRVVARAAGRPTGYFVIEARDLEEAEAIAREHPHVRRGGVIEVRPIVER